ncbi:hypothetical protein C8046_14210 [Serinibacter arcticus]|uniref:Fluoride-specific ion channel n=2 Tax=Serinibacter arcticus TaxID=1655435 RepID=A0A2U2A016_9MICO|nr:hypothetical protein C8046_14210 [Serinibacter arcticus]
MARHAVDLGLGPGRPGRSTALINVLGSFLIGLVAALATRGIVDGDLRTVLATGFLGGFTTFSAASLDVVERTEQDGRAVGMRRAIVVPVAAVAACAVGLWLGSR